MAAIRFPAAALTSLDAAAERGTAEWRARHGMPAPAGGAGLLNAANARHLSDEEVLVFRGRSWRVRPHGAADALRLIELTQALQEAAGDAARMRAVYAELVTLLWRLARPVGWRRLVMLRNPFRRATTTEVGHLLDFFARLQTRSGVRYRYQEPALPVPPGAPISWN